ncbi:MAG: FimV/HubP family polar landmark protein, partial [Vibrio sp.]
MRQLLKRLLLPLAIAAVTQISFVRAEGIRLIGPSGQVQSSPQFSTNVERNSASAESQPAKFFGPTTESETLWSIASKLRPSNQVTVQQTLLAIYRLNPQAFENQNIHSLLPGSTLRIPSLAQVRSATTAEAVRVMRAHKERLAKESRVAQKPVKKRQAPASPSTAAKNNTAVEKQAKTFEKELNSSQSELSALEERNHRLRLLLSDVQQEVKGLKEKLNDDSRIRTEFEKLQAEQQSKQQGDPKLQESMWDKLSSSPWLLALLALIPGLIIGLLVVWLLGRGKKDEPVAETVVAADSEEPSLVMADESLVMEDDDLKLDDDLFGESSGDEDALFGDDSDVETNEDDLFSELASSDIDFDLEDENDDEDLFAGIADDGDLTNDENQPSAPTEISQDDIESLLDADEPSEDLASNDLDQSMLDDLFNESEPEDVAADPLDLGLPEDLDLSSSVASDEELDELFNSISAEPDLDTLESEAQSAEIQPGTDNDAALLDELLDEAEAVTPAREEPESPISSDETAMLDELLDDEQESDDEFKLEDDSVALLDELMEGADEEESDDSELLSQLESSDQMLDELFENSDEETPEFDTNSADLLDEVLGDDISEEASWTNDPELEELAKNDPDAEADDGTELFDELLEIEKGAQEEADSDLFDSEHFIDDLISNVPEKDPLLDSVELESDAEFEPELTSDDVSEPFDFQPEIEGQSEEP